MLVCNAIEPIYISLLIHVTHINVVLSTVRALSWVAEALHRQHDFWSRSVIKTAGTVFGALCLHLRCRLLILVCR